MTDDNKEQANNFNQDSNQLSDDELDAVNGGFGLKDIAKAVVNKAVDTYQDTKESYERLKKYYK